ncbi:MAG: Ig-like domain-containing protein, partial [Halioglobus sp.]|nr:Ig-like domain-containing protein [Halioglobus sp.]
MIIRGDFLPGRLAALFVFLLALTACGGGGGGGGDAGFLPNSGNNGLRLTLFDANGAPTDTITTSSPGTLQVKAGSKGGIVVSATVTIGVLFPASGTALTDSNGIATFQLEAGEVKGAGTVSAAAVTDSGTLSGELNFQVGQSGLRLGYFDDLGTFIENQIKVEPENTLSAGGNAQLSVSILEPNGDLVTTVEDVRFNSGCIAAGQSVLNPEGTAASVNGVSSTLYTAAGCSGLDEITASLVGASAQAFGTLNVAAPETTAITFESAEPTLIVLKGTGGENRDETAEVVFTVVDGSGLPLQGVPVDFSLTTFVGGLTLSTDSTLSGGDGLVRVTVSAGDVATVVRVIASTTGTNGEVIATVSDLITVTTGLPDQNSISLALGSCGSDDGGFGVDSALNVDGLCRLLTVRMADKFNNPVVDGTAAVFTTEYGSIVGSCTTVGGNCSVEWTSQEPRFPTLTHMDFVQTIEADADYNCLGHRSASGPCPDDLGFTRGGRSQILVHAIGEESFIDANGNGIMDQEESDLFANLPEAFIDQNEDGVYTPADPFCLANPQTPRCIAGQEEIFIDFDDDELYDFNDDPAVYNGLLCPPKGDGIWCSRSLVNVRDDNIVVLNNDPNWFFLFVDDDGDPINRARNGEFVTLYTSDFYNNPPSGGSTINISASEDCEILGQTDFEAPNTLAYGAWGVSFVSDRNPDATFENFVPGTITVELTTDAS